MARIFLTRMPANAHEFSPTDRQPRSGTIRDNQRSSALQNSATIREAATILPSTAVFASWPFKHIMVGMPLTISDEMLHEAGLTEQEARIEIACRLYGAVRWISAPLTLSELPKSQTRHVWIRGNHSDQREILDAEGRPFSQILAER